MPCIEGAGASHCRMNHSAVAVAVAVAQVMNSTSSGKETPGVLCRGMVGMVLVYCTVTPSPK